MLGNSTTVCIYHNGELQEVHPRLNEPHIFKSTKQSHLKPWERTFEEQSIYRRKARQIGEWTEKLILAILASQRGFIDTRKVWGILSLDKT